MIDHGLGKNLYSLSYFTIKDFLKGLYITEICWTLAILIVKCSIIAFYWRTFSHVKWARITIFVLVGVTVCWGIAVVSIRSSSLAETILNLTSVALHDLHMYSYQ